MTETRTIKASHLWPGMILASRPDTRLYDIQGCGEDIDGTVILKLTFKSARALYTRVDTDVDILVEVE